MKVRFWGTRGSIATPGAATVRYGGNTSCVEVRSNSGTLVLIDCGTGASALARALAEQGGPCSGHILISHTHWDHIQGLPFFAPLFVAGNEWHIYGPRGLGQSLREVLEGQMQYAYFPVELNALAAKVHFHEIVEGGFSVGDIRVATQYLNHPALTVGYRLEADGASLVYASDHEPHNTEANYDTTQTLEGSDAAHVEFMRDADLVIHDAQYTANEYPKKVGWGHSPCEYAVDAAIAANAKQLVLFHHDPTRTDAGVDELVTAARLRVSLSGSGLIVSGAAEGATIELTPSDEAEKFSPYLPSSLVKPTSEAGEEMVLAAGIATRELNVIAAAAEADGIPLISNLTIENLIDAVRGGKPSLVFLGDGLADTDPLDLCQRLRALSNEEAKDLPIIIVTAQAKMDAGRGEAVGVTDWLSWPFSVQYARSRMRAWLMRSMLRWRKAALPPDEEERLDSVHKLGLLDTEAEERFDRHARIAAAALEAPICLVTLVDRDRQWFKSHQGFDYSETPRDLGFCSHAVLADAPLVVTDALKDDRFAENPVVIGDPHVRFYAGIPLHSPDGAAVGAFCIVDHKPRNLSPAQMRMLQDIARLIEEEFDRPAEKKAS